MTGCSPCTMLACSCLHRPKCKVAITRFLATCFLLLFLAVPSIASGEDDSEKSTAKVVDANAFGSWDIPEIKPTRADQLERLKTHRLSATLQVTIPTSFFHNQVDALAYLMYELGNHFPNQMLPNHRRYHSTIFHLDDLSIYELAQIKKLLENIPARYIKEFGLNRTVDSFNFDEPLEFRRLGVESVFLGIKPPKSFVEWQVGWYRLIQHLSTDEAVPEYMRNAAKLIIEKHLSHFRDASLKKKALTEYMPHYSIVQLRRKEIKEAAPTKKKRRRRLVSEFRIVEAAVRSILEEFRNEWEVAHHGKEYRQTFDLHSNPLQLVMAPRSVREEPTEAVAFKLSENGMLAPSSVVRFFVPVHKPNSQDEHSHTEPVELYGAKLSEEGVDAAIIKSNSIRDSWAEPRRKFPTIPVRDFMEMTGDERIARIFYDTVKSGALSPTFFPASTPTALGDVIVANETIGSLIPDRGVEKLRLAQRLVKDTSRVTFGFALYASLVNGVFEWSGDADIAVAALVHLPEDKLHTKEERSEYVAKVLEEDFFAPLLNLADQGVITEIEWRASSAFDLGYSKDPIRGREDAPYFVQNDRIRGYTIHPTTKQKIYFSDAIRAKNFIKGKLKVNKPEQLFEEGGDKVLGKFRVKTSEDGPELSLQTIAGSNGLTELGHNAVFFFQTDAVKGVPPVMRTAVYAGPKDYAVFASLHRPYIAYSVQKGSQTSRSIGELFSAGITAEGFRPKWNAKFVKKSHNLKLFFRQSGSGLDEIVARRTMDLMKRHGLAPEGFNEKHPDVVEYLLTLKNNLRTAFNQPVLKTLSEVRRRVNDIREYNQRKNLMPVDLWIERYELLSKDLHDLKCLLEFYEAQELLTNNESFYASMKAFQDTISMIGELPLNQALQELQNLKHFRVFRDFETELTVLDGRIASMKIPPDDLVYVETLIRYLPYMYMEYMQTRKLLSNHDLELELRQMDIEPTLENIEIFRNPQRIYDMDQSELLKLERKIFGLDKKENAPDCDDILSS